MLRCRIPLLASLALSLGVLAVGTAPAQAQTIAKQFTYQGFLENNGVPYNGTATFDIYLHSTLTGGVSRDRAALNINVPVTKGVFSLNVNFGETDNSGQPVYNGTPMYLEIVVTLSNGTTFPLSPRQLVQPAPYAISALGVQGINVVNGLVGIGTANPLTMFHVAGNNNAAARLQSSSTIGTWLDLYNTSAGGRIWSLISTGTANGEGAGKLLFSDQTGGGPRLVLDTDGDVGIGTTTPAAKLHVVGSIRYSSDANPTLSNSFEITSGAAIDLIANNDIYMNARGGRKHILLNSDAAAGNVGIGTVNPAEKLEVAGNIKCDVLIVDGGSDVSESYDVASIAGLEPAAGMVVSIDPEMVGKLRVSTGAYDRTVAGIISGANGIAPGLVLNQRGTVADGRHPIANVGRVWCLVDADIGGPIKAGDLLTTSSTPGHAMRVSNHENANGAVLGKAMSSLKSGKGMVLVLVGLQ